MAIKPLGDARHHYWMTIKMGDALGKPLDQAWAEARLTPDRYDAMITRCRGCDGAQSCARLLDARPALDTPPAYCANRAVWAELGRT